jgi:hypothetical protein
MNYPVIVLGIIIVMLIYLLYVYYYSPSSSITKLANLMVVNPPITTIAQPDNINYSYGIWVYVNSWNNNMRKVIFGRQDNIMLYLENDKPTLNCGVMMNDNSVQTVTFTDNFPLQKWVYVIVSVDGNIVDGYLNGKLVKSVKLNGIAKQPSADPEAYPISLGGGKTWDAIVAAFTRRTKPTDPQTAWDTYLAGNGQSGALSSSGSTYGANLSFVKNSIPYTDIKLF